MKTAIVTGVPGQDASYLCELLLDKGYHVIGVSRRSNRINSNMINCEGSERYENYKLDICDTSGVRNLVSYYKPDEMYNLAAISHVGQSFREPLQTLLVNGYAVVSMLEAIRHESPNTRFYQASTSEMFGSNVTSHNASFGKCIHFQDENTPFSPNSPYAAAKVYAHQMVDLYRRSYNLHASCGILFNHESPRRGLDFVTRKITDGIARIKCGKLDKLRMGNLEAIRDWGHAREYVEAMWMMLQKDNPDDYVIATGESVSVRDALQYVCDIAELDFNSVYEEDPRFMRPSDVPYLRGNASKAKEVLGWSPKISWKALLEEMYLSDFSIHSSSV